MINPRTLPARIGHLKAAGMSGAHCFHSFQLDDSDSLSRRLGAGTHALLFGQPTATWDQPSKASVKRQEKAAKAGKPPTAVTRAPRSGEDWLAFTASHPGAVILTAKEHDAARRMVDAIRANSIADRLLSAPGLLTERTLLWSQCGRARRSTPDMHRLADSWGPSFNAEIKTTRCAAPFLFGRDAQRLGYHAQLADQAAAIEYAHFKRPTESLIVAVESSPPHVVQVYEVPRTILEDGAKLCSIWLERLQMYEALDLWGGYSERIETLAFPERSGPVIADPSWADETAAADADEEAE